MQGRRRLLFVAVGLVAAIIGIACDSSDDEERLAAQRLFRSYLLQQDVSIATDVRIQGLVDDLPPDFPLFEGLELLGSAFSDTDDSRELIVGWETSRDVEEVFIFYSRELDTEPWSIRSGPGSNERLAGIDFIKFSDIDNAAFSGELRISQEGNDAVVVLIAREFIQSADTTPTGS